MKPNLVWFLLVTRSRALARRLAQPRMTHRQCQCPCRAQLNTKDGPLDLLRENPAVKPIAGDRYSKEAWHDGDGIFGMETG